MQHAYTARLNGFVSAQAVPEPGSGALALVALAGAAVARRRRGDASRRDYFSRREPVSTRRN